MTTDWCRCSGMPCLGFSPDPACRSWPPTRLEFKPTASSLLPPPGTHLATSGDGGEVLLWEPIDAAAAAARRGNLCEDDGEASWRRCTAFKGHSAVGDVMDLSWAPDGTALASGAIDNEAYLFVAAGRKRGDAAGRFKDHKHFVQVGRVL